MSNLQVVIVPNNMVHTIWDPVETLLQTIVDKAPNDVNIRSVYDSTTKGETLLTVIMDETGLIVAVNVLDVRKNDTGYKYLMIPLTAGERMDEWLDPFMEIAFNIARDRGCAAIRGMSIRHGWTRALKNYGCKEVHTTIEMPIPPKQNNKMINTTKEQL